MTKANTGGAAFPVLHPSKECHYADKGMTLRDYFAVNAMHAMLRNQPPHAVDEPYATWADDAYDIADAMLKVRGVK